MAHNPELDHEFSENKIEQKPTTFVYQANDGETEPFEMLAVNRAANEGKRTDKKRALLALVGFGALLLILAAIFIFADANAHVYK